MTVPLLPDARKARALAVLRIGVPLFFLIFAQYNLRNEVYAARWLSVLDQQISKRRRRYPFMEPILRGSVLSHATPIAFLVAYGEFAIGLALILGVFVRAASVAGFVFMLPLLFASDYPGSAAPLWQYFGASLSHSIFAFCFVTFLLSDAGAVWSLSSRKK